MEKLGYEVAASVFNAADFGVPQQRNRAWILCILKTELKTSANQMVQDMNQFQCQCVKLGACIDLKAPLSASTKGGKVQEKNVKWKTGFEEQCQKFGKVTFPHPAGRASILMIDSIHKQNLQ